MVVTARAEDLTTTRQNQLKAAIANMGGVDISVVTLTISPTVSPSANTLLFVINFQDASSSSAVASTLGSQLSSAESATEIFGLPVGATPTIATVGSPAPPSAPASAPGESNSGVVVALGVILAMFGLVVLCIWRRTGGGVTVAHPVTRGYDVGSKGGDVTISRTNCNSYPVNETPCGYNLDRNSAAQGEADEPGALPMFFESFECDQD